MKTHKKPEPRLCDFNRISVGVPRYKLIELLFKRSYLQEDEVIFLKALHWKVEAAEHKMLHVKSIINKALLKGP